MKAHLYLRQGSNERDSSSPTERVSPVILSEAKELSAERDRPFASLRVTRWDGCNCEGLFFTTEPCLNKLNAVSPVRRSRRRGRFIAPTADLSAPGGLPDYFVKSHYRPPVDFPLTRLKS